VANRIINFKYLDWLIEKSFREDLNSLGDVTTRAIIPDSKQGKATLVAKQDGILAGMVVLQRVFLYGGSRVSVSIFKNDGSMVKRGDIIADIEGSVYDILRAERIALNFLQRLSGIATLTQKFVEKIKGTGARILDTRKTTPCFRELEKYAVKTGGGENHRFGLFDMMLIKDNHIKSAGSITEAVKRGREYLLSKGKENEILIEVETTDLTQVREALALPIHRIMLDNMSVEMMKEAVDIISGEKETEASGNVSISNVRDIAETGVDYISIGSLTHSAPCFDVSLLLVD